MNHHSAFHKQLLRSQQGSVLLMAIIGGVIVCIMFFASIAYVETQAKMMARSANKTDRRIVMDGLYAYTVNAIKQSWCLSPSWVQEMNCSLTHPRNTQRLLLSDESLLFIRNSGTPHAEPLSATRLKTLSTTVQLKDFTESHPLYSIIRPLKEEYSTGTFTIERDATAISAVRGKEVPLKITIALKHKNNSQFDEVLVSKNIVYPRELSYFSLILPNDLYLNVKSSSAQNGNNTLNAQSVAAGAGLRFESPVFVNGDLHLPSSSHRPAMNNVVFVDKVVLGGGRIMMDNKSFMVSSAGGEGSMYNYEMKNFAGLLGGYELDPGRDTGLDFLYNIVPGDSTSFDAQKLCRARLMASYDLIITNPSQLWSRANSASANRANVSFNVGNVDNFVEQANVTGFEAVTTVPNVSTAAMSSSTTTTGTPVLKARVYYNGLQAPGGSRGAYITDFYVHRQGTVTLYPTGTGGSTITITTAPLTVSGRTQFNQVDMNIEFSPGLDLAPYKSNGSVVINSSPSVKFVFEAYDYGYLNGNNLRVAGGSPFFKNKINGVTFTKSGNDMVLAANTANLGVNFNKWRTNSGLEASDDYNYPLDSTYIGLHVPKDNPENLAEFDDRCFATPDPGDPGADFSAFPAATWDTSFARQARHAWMFNTEWSTRTEPGYYEGAWTYGTSNAFTVHSLVKECRISENATLIAGMFACETFTILPRSRPLRIIGTVITNQLNIDASAYRAGIRWSSIYHPQATQELINAGILGRDKAGAAVDCSPGALAPLWQSNIGITDRYAHWVCNPVSLRSADPFKWTTVDPDCGIVNARDTLVKCKKQSTRFLIKEVSRGKGL
ncbi:hypothetical protein [Bdellovibrio sp. HCB274]|uniref:hypothetical protein n=1 Tax=Bdellovibrio sp. HCB274 TaxID=3394361 RepID=UPI0039B406D3